ncbi:MAG TPA: S8 family peptidase, partial [Pseudobdellovibrionaceae bacterium]|nr:S8 family peptidase [Pseudobdellovibrionaceae bacterium]
MRLMERATRLAVAIIASAGLNAFAAEPEAVPGEYLVKMHSPISEDKAALNVLSEQLGATIKSTIPGMQIVVIQRAVMETSESVKEVMAMNSDVEYVEPNYIYRTNRTPDDPMLGQLWGMNNAQNPGVDINALKAWDIETGNQDLIVAIIDTGIDYNHPDLVDNMWVNEAEANGLPGVDDDGNGVVDDIHGFNAINNSGDPMDDNGHGTHCAGTIGAKGNDGKGIVGVAWNVKLMGSKFLSASGGGTLEGAVRAIDYATRMGAKVLSNSWGGGGFSQALFDVIQRSNEAGNVFVAAAGNSRSNNDSAQSYPANYDVPNIISVAAVDRAGKLASFSSYGKNKVHVAAPGVDVYSAARNGQYATMSGTSMATPHVSGVVALMLSHDRTL